ncbi:tRNA pseudouridine(55) synthase TruB [Peribacillus acanthi]|uniref:tRNA pseudouridine(55) synthase TruB n=1 Tax=Peribacillus acanthi TaxID=2171554 RepID=UPI000D3E8A36|nr:tRNA pseudouridine(55) synthase TruB [Peribacillus acanthi]
MEGILPLLKPRGMTSHDCVFKLRKILRTKKVGHTGTLDPEVTGVLPICVGRATKIAEYITDAGKEYVGEVTIGTATTTEDAHGEVVSSKVVDQVFSRQQILSTLNQYIGEITQIPPMYSAIKVNGKKLYEYARAGIEVERPIRTVTIYEMELLDDRDHFEGESISFRFRVKCSKGTYIRTLAVMIGESLGYPAHMSHLVRTQSASFHIDNCYTFEDLERMSEEGTINNALLPLEIGISHLPKIKINDKVAEKVKNGAVLDKEECGVSIPNEPFAVFYGDNALAIYQVHPDKPSFIKPVKVLRIEL